MAALILSPFASGEAVPAICVMEPGSLGGLVPSDRNSALASASRARA